MPLSMHEPRPLVEVDQVGSYAGVSVFELSLSPEGAAAAAGGSSGSAGDDGFQYNQVPSAAGLNVTRRPDGSVWVGGVQATLLTSAVMVPATHGLFGDADVARFVQFLANGGSGGGSRSKSRLDKDLPETVRKAIK